MSKHHKYTISIQSATEAEAAEKMKALAVLASRLTAPQLTKLAHIVQHDPVKMAIAKKYLGV